MNKLLIAAAVASVLVGCGGSGSGSEPDTSVNEQASTVEFVEVEQLYSFNEYQDDIGQQYDVLNNDINGVTSYTVSTDLQNRVYLGQEQYNNKHAEVWQGNTGFRYLSQVIVFDQYYAEKFRYLYASIERSKDSSDVEQQNCIDATQDPDAIIRDEYEFVVKQEGYYDFAENKFIRQRSYYDYEFYKRTACYDPISIEYNEPVYIVDSDNKFFATSNGDEFYFYIERNNLRDVLDKSNYDVNMKLIKDLGRDTGLYIDMDVFPEL